MNAINQAAIRPATTDDLANINAIIEACVMSWDLPDRVKRLSVNSYQYSELDLKHLSVVVAVTASNEIAGVAAWEPANPSDLPENTTGNLLHGLYVSPMHQNRGIGALLTEHALTTSLRDQTDGLLVKAQADANGFFEKQGFNKLPIRDTARDYPHRWWKPVT